MNKDLILKRGDIVTYLDCNNKEHTIIIDTYDGRRLKDFEQDDKVLKVERPKYETIYEIKEILDDKEREYLGNFIRPFRNKIINIEKILSYDEEKEWMCIALKKEQSIKLPYFKSNTMYKGMELNKEYTLEELGL